MTFFSIERTFFQNISFDLLNTRSLPYGGFKFKYFFQTHSYLIAVH